MKKLTLISAIAVASAVSALGQTVTNTPVQPFINTLANWVTSYNTNLSWGSEISLDTGIATTTGQQIADKIQLLDHMGSFEFGASGNFTGVGSAFNAFEGDAGYALVNKYDFQFGVRLGAGYDFNIKDSKGQTGAFIVDPGIFAMKKITQNTYTRIEYGFPVETKGKFNKVGVFYVGAGFTF